MFIRHVLPLNVLVALSAWHIGDVLEFVCDVRFPCDILLVNYDFFTQRLYLLAFYTIYIIVQARSELISIIKETFGD